MPSARIDIKADNKAGNFIVGPHVNSAKLTLTNADKSIYIEVTRKDYPWLTIGQSCVAFLNVVRVAVVEEPDAEPAIIAPGLIGFDKGH